MMNVNKSHRSEAEHTALMEMRQTKQMAKTTLVFLITTLLAFPVWTTSSRAAAAPSKIVISYASLSEREGALFVARDQGFFRKQGLEVDLVYVASAPVALASIAHGDSQINTGSTSGAILGAMAGGLDLAFIAGLVNKLTGTIVTAPDIRRPADLKNKTIGVTSIGGGNWVFTMLALEHWGLDPKRDNISIRVIGNDAVRAQAITTGTIDATQLSTYSYATALRRQGYRVFPHSSANPKCRGACSLVSHRSLQQLREDLSSCFSCLASIDRGRKRSKRMPANKSWLRQSESLARGTKHAIPFAMLNSID